jgi:hypothetical protein
VDKASVSPPGKTLRLHCTNRAKRLSEGLAESLQRETPDSATNRFCSAVKVCLVKISADGTRVPLHFQVAHRTVQIVLLHFQLTDALLQPTPGTPIFKVKGTEQIAASGQIDALCSSADLNGARSTN